ncbi:MAG TPA: FHA domain-containing protein [Pseudomonadota bacterium]|nr:FHA domain-containing protein [Pseudomonadota bacterium]
MRIDLDLVSQGSDSVRRLRFDLPSIRIGRGDDCELSLPADPLLGRRQCALEWHAGSLFLFPLRGSGDTVLNSVKVNRPLPLSSGDVIEVGSQIIKVFFVPPDLSYPSDGPRRLTLKVTEPAAAPRLVECEQALLRICPGAHSDIYIGEPKPSRLYAQDPVEAVIFWSAAGMPHLLLHKYSAVVQRNGEPIVGVTALCEGDTLTMAGTQIDVREIESPAEPPRPPLGLLILDGDEPPRWHFTTRGQLSFGSAKTADVQLADPSLPSQCFSIERQKGRLWLLPGGAAQTLYLNFAKVTTATAIQHGDRVSYGEVLIHIDRKTLPPTQSTASERRVTLTISDGEDEPRDVFWKDEAVRLGTTPQSEIEWPTHDDLLVDLLLLWHPDGTPRIHVGMWSADAMLDGTKLRRCTLCPLHIGAKLESAGTTAIVKEIVPRPVAQPTK